jgi:hypothetical protein
MCWNICYFNDKILCTYSETKSSVISHYSLMLEREKVSETCGCESKLIWLFTQKMFYHLYSSWKFQALGYMVKCLVIILREVNDFFIYHFYMCLFVQSTIWGLDRCLRDLLWSQGRLWVSSADPWQQRHTFHFFHHRSRVKGTLAGISTAPLWWEQVVLHPLKLWHIGPQEQIICVW